MTLVAEGLRFAYGDGPDVLNGVDLEVKPGEVVVLLGPNGAGKSTLLKALGGLIKPREGRALLGETGVMELPRRYRARALALVPQALLASPDLTVHDFVSQGRYAHLRRFRGLDSEDRAAVARALVESDVEDLAARSLAELSGGQRQRALIARALAQEPRFVLVDEPTNSLDPAHQLRVFELIAGMGCAGRAALVVTHDLNLASQFATRVLLLQSGRIAANGTANEVLTPDVLSEVYGDVFVFGEELAAGWNESRPWAIPWRRSVAKGEAPKDA